MNNNQETTLNLIDSPDAIPWYLRKERAAITPQLFKRWLIDYEDIKKTIDEMSAEVSQRQDKMKFINDIISTLNMLTDDKNGLDLKEHPEILEKLKIASEELGVRVPTDKETFNSLEFARLIQNLNLAADTWDKDNKMGMQKIDVQNKIADRMMMMLNTIQKNEHQTISRLVQAVK